MPSLRYQYKSDDLRKQCQEGKIDHNKYLEQLEQIKSEEIIKAIERSPMKSISLEQRDFIEDDISKYEWQKSLPKLESYKENVLATISGYRRKSNYYRFIANILQIFIIVGSVLVTSATSALGFGFGDAFKWIAPAISILVAISAGLTGYFKFRERSFNLQQTADAIEQEYNAVELGIGIYKGKQPNDLEIFAERVQFMKEEQNKRQQQLEQPPDMKHGQSHI
ncbi:MAG TPA: DUF4231 domain-containing protein [Methylomirabilota bacterium]|nr:DUF4231 domain-containing protein [Methylomirabilota bacterium]